MTMFQQGDTAAFERLFERYRCPVFNFLYRLLNHRRESAEDILQNIFIKLARFPELYDPTFRFRPWLYAIARNHGLNHLRSSAFRHEQQAVSFDDLYPPEMPRLPGIGAGPSPPSAVLVSRDEQVRLERMIDRLTSPAHEIFLLRAVDHLSHDDIADIVRMNPVTVRTHYHRARARLAQWLIEEGDDG